MNALKTCTLLGAAVLMMGTAQAKKPGTVPVIGPDLAVYSFGLKTKCGPATCAVNNATLVVRNEGDADVANCRVTFYLSTDTTLTTQTDALNPVADIPLHTQSLGTVKAGRTKKRTLGGGLLKKASPASGNYVIAEIDSDNAIEEANELNNIISSKEIP